MGKTIYSDNTDINGVNYATVGENIREGAKALTYESVEPVLEENIPKVLDVLNISWAELRNVIVFMFSSNALYGNLWGDYNIPALSEQEKQEIKTYLGIN